MATRSKKGINSASSIQLSNGRQLPLPSWMTVRHLPEYGISAVSAHTTNAASAAAKAPTLTDAAAGNDNEVDGSRSTKRRKASAHREEQASTAADAGTKNSSDKNAHISIKSQVVASNYKSQKEAAMDCKYPPTTQEINSHIRYLSERAIHLVMQEVDDCVEYCLRYSSTPADNTNNERKGLDISKRVQGRGGGDLMLLATEIHNFFDKFQPHEEEEDREKDTSKLASVEKEDRKESQETATENDAAILRRNILKYMLPTKYDPTLLPIITIKCYPNVLDRGVMTNGLLQDLSKQKHTNPRLALATVDDTQQMHPCVCIIRSTSELVIKGHMLMEVLSQCMSNDPNGKAFAMELQRQQKRHKSQHHGGVNKGILVRSIWSWTRSLVDWAGFTEAFDSIVVILEDPEKIPSPTLDTFFTSLASLRSNEGVPISAIVIDATPGGLGDRLSKLRDPSLRSTTGVMMHEIFVPLPQVQLDIFVNRLYSGKCLPTFFWTNNHILKHVQQVFQDCDNSLVSVARQLKTQLRRHFAKPVAITSMLNCENFTGPNEARLRWLLGDEQCRKQMMLHCNSTKPLMVGAQRDGHIHGLFWNWQTSYLCHQIYQRIYAIFNMSALEDIGQWASTDRYSRMRMRELLLLLGNVKDKATTSRYSHHASWSSFHTSLNEYIILAGKFALDENSSDAYDFLMARELVENILGWAGRQFTMQERLEGTSPVQPRRDVAISFLRTPGGLSRNSLSRASRIAFQVFSTQSRVMTLADWHEKYFDIVAGDDGQEVGAPANEAAFYFAVYSLVHCGFVKKLITGGRKEQAYEKVAIAWGSGR